MKAETAERKESPCVNLRPREVNAILFSYLQSNAAWLDSRTWTLPYVAESLHVTDEVIEGSTGTTTEETEKTVDESKKLTMVPPPAVRQISPQDGARSSLRLVNGSSSFEGRVEILHDGQWGTICDDGANANACIVICKQLGFAGGLCVNEQGILGCKDGSTRIYGEGMPAQKIWVDDLTCTGIESIIDECLKSNWGVHNCLHKEDFACQCEPPDQGSVVRLVNGSSPNEGRIEVYHNKTWGTVCDDLASDNACRVICRQLNLMGGKCVNEVGQYGCEPGSSARFGVGTERIWIDDLTCTGMEESIDECPKKEWGDVYCLHKEDLSCICSNRPSHTPGVCDPSRHRLTANDPSVPGIGRVEVKDPVTDSWGVVCDDSWNDLDATVFCLCVGFVEQMYFHSLSNQPTIEPSLPLLFDAVYCQPDNVANRTSLFDCATEPVSPGRCNAVDEAAYVACTAFPNITEPETPAPNVTCQGTLLHACFQLTQGVATGSNGSHFQVHPLCSEAGVTHTADTLCYEIDFTICPSAPSLSTNTTKPYCYDISYSTFDDHADTLITDHTWSTRVCCEIDRNATAVASFRPIIDQLSHDVSVRLSLADQRKLINYTVQCFTETNFSGVPIDFPAVVYRGTELFCKVHVNTWDKNLYLVVTSCQFLTSLDSHEDNTTYYFVKDKCITPLGKSVGLRLHSIDNLSWGFRFQMPKFQGFDLLYLSCATSVCDKRRDPKPDCDRSCLHQTRRRRHDQDDPPVASKGQRSVDDQQPMLGHGSDETDIGPFIVWGLGQGYVISKFADVLVFQRSATAVPDNLTSSSVGQCYCTSMTQTTLVHFLAVFCLLFV